MLVIFHVMHTVKIISAYLHILPKPHINVLYIFLMKTKRELFYILKKNEKAVVFDIFNFTVITLHSLNSIFAAINMFK